MSMKDEKLWVCDMIQLDDSVKDYVNFYIANANHIATCIIFQEIIKQSINPYMEINVFHDFTKTIRKLQVIGYAELYRFKETDIPLFVKSAIEYHYEYENHHPEHFREIKSMDEDNISEMVANWMAIAYANHEPYDYYWKI